MSLRPFLVAFRDGPTDHGFRHSLLAARGENGCADSFNGNLCDDLLDREILYTLTEAKILIERWRQEYNTARPHSVLRNSPPALEAIMLAALVGLEMSPALSRKLARPRALAGC